MSHLEGLQIAPPTTVTTTMSTRMLESCDHTHEEHQQPQEPENISVVTAVGPSQDEKPLQEEVASAPVQHHKVPGNQSRTLVVKVLRLLPLI